MPLNNATLCPHLGSKGDPGTTFAFASSAHCCFHCQPPLEPVPEHQVTVCLTPAHTDCPVYAQAAGKPLAKDLRSQAGEIFEKHSLPGRRLPYWIALFLLPLLGWAFFHFVLNDSVPPLAIFGYQPTSTTTPTSKPPATALPEITPVSTATVAASPTAQPSPTMTVAPQRTNTPHKTQTDPAEAATLQVHALEIPIMVGEQQLIIHQVKTGESLWLLADQYDTLVEAIQQMNVTLPSPLWVDSLVVLSPGMMYTDPTSPMFEVYHVGAEQVDIDKISGNLNMDPLLMRFYNNCLESCLLKADDWLLIPRLR
jgi:hypothetical protein